MMADNGAHLRIRNATENDADVLHALAARCQPLDAHAPDAYLVLLSTSSDGCFVMDADDGNPIGFVTSVDFDGTTFIWQMGILPEFRGRRLSEPLISSVMTHARRSGSRRVVTTMPDAVDACGMAFASYAREHGLVMEEMGAVAPIGDDMGSSHTYSISMF